MISRYPRLEAVRPAANAKIENSAISWGEYTITMLPDDSTTVRIGGRTQYFPSFCQAQEYLELFAEGKHDQAIPFVSGGCLLIISGSIVKRAPLWVQNDARDLSLGDMEYVWYFTFNHPYGTDFCIFDTYQDAIQEIHRLIERESGGEALPF
jgi:hypothetical protein